ncbi:hypothetical protein JWV37_00130 [Sulfurospirillum sp. T05]|uniref:Uncharacterized protein n=1 Tax=Sulfurospirillum tamanense TaxID=2813362 RepID=A0ABS2WP40_9BACT|nr:hypothetical protein [Sulfurospirillum tamanensis]MBN2963173.1 hypothetical protein [Sulfurospirillum tamanensis]
MSEESFCDVLKDAYEQIMQESHFVDKEGKEIESLMLGELNLGDDDNLCFQHLDNFFQNIPREKWENEAYEIARMLEVLSLQKDSELYNERTKELRMKKGSLLKKDDIKALEGALTVLEKLFHIEYDGKVIKSVDDISNDIFDTFPPSYFNGIKTLDFIKKTMLDIKSGEYNQGFYYEQQPPAKQKLKDYLDNLNKQYNAKGGGHIKKFIDALDILQYANLI